MKKFIGFLLSLAMLLTFIPSVGAEPANNSEIKTPADYIAYLESLTSSSQKTPLLELQKNDISNSENFLEQFKSLSEEKQQKFVDYLNDPEFAKQIFEAQPTNGVESTKSLFNGDVVVTNSIVEVPLANNSMISSDFSTNAIGDTMCYGGIQTAKTVVFGMDLIVTQVFINVEVVQVAAYSSQIKQILNSGGDIIQNYYPAAAITKDKLTPYITSNKMYANQTVHWQWNFLWSGFGLTVGTREQWVQVDKAGNATGDCYNL